MAVMEGDGFRLAHIDRHNWHAALAVRVTPAQLPFVAAHQPVALVVLAKAYVRPRGLDWEPLAVSRGETVVAVAALAHASAHSELFHLAVDVDSQRKGTGSAAVQLLVQHVRSTRPAAQHLRLTVHPENEPAQQLYRKCGFSPIGEVLDGEAVWTFDLLG